MRNFFVSVRGIEQGGAPQCASKAPVGLCLARGRFPFGSYRLKGFPLWGKLSPQVTDEGELCGHCNNTGWFVAVAGHFPLIRRWRATFPQGGRLYRAVGAGHAPPAIVHYNEQYGLVCRGGIYAARCNRPDITNYRANRTERSRPFPTNLPEICILPHYTLSSDYL